MNAAQQRRLAHLTLGLEQQWLTAWEAWGVTLAGEWRKVDPNAPEAYASSVQPYEQEWVEQSTAEERAGFLSRGASLCEQWGLPGELWVWFWRDVYGPVLDGDLSVWPRLIPLPPQHEDIRQQIRGQRNVEVLLFILNSTVIVKINGGVTKD